MRVSCFAGKMLGAANLATGLVFIPAQFGAALPRAPGGRHLAQLPASLMPCSTIVLEIVYYDCYKIDGTVTVGPARLSNGQLLLPEESKYGAESLPGSRLLSRL